jgi:hypothetical protein
MSEHTPGPWKAVSAEVSPMYRGIVAIVKHSPDSFLGVVAERGVTQAHEWEANARLIAAAPLLAQSALGAYHLCESLLAVREGATDELIREIRDGLKESILKAELELQP